MLQFWPAFVIGVVSAKFYFSYKILEIINILDFTSLTLVCKCYNACYLGAIQILRDTFGANFIPLPYQCDIWCHFSRSPYLTLSRDIYGEAFQGPESSLKYAKISKNIALKF